MTVIISGAWKVMTSMATPTTVIWLKEQVWLAASSSEPMMVIAGSPAREVANVGTAKTIANIIHNTIQNGMGETPVEATRVLSLL
jgi:hypothetical protein